ncbi:MAG: hypothetical protein AB7F78_00855 [Hyphomicrobiaceae bacterium]
MAISLAILLPDSGGGGINTFYAPYLLGNKGAFQRSIAIDANPFAHQLDVDADHLPILPPPLNIYLAVARDAYARALESKADVLETCDWPLSFAPAVLEQRAPYIVQCHGSMGQIAEYDPQEGAGLLEAIVQLIEPQLLQCAHRIQTSTHANQSFWERTTGRSVQLIRPAFALPPLPSDLTVQPIGRAFGRLQRWKGPHILCEALVRLGKHAPQIDWHGGVKPWGSGDWPADRRIATDFPGVFGVSFHHRPAIPRDEVLKLQASALFNVIPSTWDVFNFTAVESMAARVPPSFPQERALAN